MFHMLHDILGEGSLEDDTQRPQSRPGRLLMNGDAGDLLLMRCRGVELEHSLKYADHDFPKSIFNKCFAFTPFCKHLQSHGEAMPLMSEVEAENKSQKQTSSWSPGCSKQNCLVWTPSKEKEKHVKSLIFTVEKYVFYNPSDSINTR